MPPVLLELAVKGALKLPDIHLQLTDENGVTVIQCPQNCPRNVHQLASTALLLMCGFKDMDAFIMFQKASIHLVFLAPQALKSDFLPSPNTPTVTSYAWNKISVTRDFLPDMGMNVEYTINDEKTVHRIVFNKFCEKYFKDVDSILPHLRELQLNPKKMPIYNSWQNSNWWSLLRTTFTSNFTAKVLQELNTYAKECDRESDELTKLSTSCLFLLNAMNVIHKTQICRILQDARRIFKRITGNEYKVWFLVPYLGELIDIMHCTTSFELKCLKARIQLSTEPLTQQSFSCKNVECALQDLLLVAFQLALACNCNQQIVFLQQMEHIANRQSLKEGLEEVLKTTGDSNTNYSYDYLQYIIDVCNERGLTAVIEYPGTLSTKPINANFVKCEPESDDEYQLYVVTSDTDVAQSDDL